MSNQRLFLPLKVWVIVLGALTFCLTAAKMAETVYGEYFSQTPARAYQVVLPDEAGRLFPKTPYMLAELLKTSLPEDVHVARSLKWPLEIALSTDETVYANVEFIEPSVFPMLNLEVSHQMPGRSFGSPNNVVVSRTFAERFLQGNNALGEEIEVNLQSGEQVMIVAAILDSSSSVSEIGRSDIFIRLNADYFSNTPYLFRSSQNAQFSTYMSIPDERLDQTREVLSSITKRLSDTVGAQKLKPKEADILKLRRAPSAHLSGKLAAMNYPPRTIFRMLLLLSISGLLTSIIAIAVFTLIDYRKAVESFAIRNLLGQSKRTMAFQLWRRTLPSIFLGTLLGLSVSCVLIYGPLRDIQIPLKSQFFTVGLTAVTFLIAVIFTAAITAFLALASLKAERMLSGILERSYQEEFFVQLSFAVQVMLCSVSIATALHVGFSLNQMLNKDRGFNQDNVVFITGLSYDEVPRIIRMLEARIGPGNASGAFLRLGTNMQGFPVKIIRRDGQAAAIITQTDYTGPLLSILEVESLSGLDAKSANLWNENKVVLNVSAAKALGFELPDNAIGAKLIRSSVDVGSTSLFPRTTLTVASVIKDVELQSPFKKSQPTIFVKGGFPASVVLRVRKKSEIYGVIQSLKSDSSSILQVVDFDDVESAAFGEEFRAGERIAYAGGFLAINSIVIIGALLLQFMALKGRRVNVYTRLGAPLRHSFSLFVFEPIFIGISSLTSGVFFAWAVSPLLQRQLPIFPPAWSFTASITVLVIVVVFCFGMIAPIYVLRKS